MSNVHSPDQVSTQPSAPKSGLLRRTLEKIGVDRAVAFALLSRGWGALSGVIGLALQLRFFTPIEQGFYGTFGSFMALQVFFELGLGFVILQFASHERAGLEWTPQGTLEGDVVAKARLSSLLRRSLLWYGVLSGLMLVVVLPLGVWFLHAVPLPPGVQVAWQLPWIGVALLMSGTLAMTPLLAVLEGCGLVAEVMAAQFVAGLLNSLGFWLTLCLHGGLYGVSAGYLLGFCWMAGWLWTRKRGFVRDLASSAQVQTVISWRDEIWPFQWKIGLSWLSGYFIFELFAPVLMRVRGPVAAGQMTISLSVTTALSALALAWVTTKSAPFGSLIARREWAKLDRAFFPCLWQSTTVLALTGAAFWGASLYLNHLGLVNPLAQHLSRRILNPQSLALLLGATLINHVVIAQSIYLRAHKQEPFLALSLSGGVLVGLSTVILGRLFGAAGMMGGYFGISLVVGLGAGTWLFLQKRREWHDDPPEAALPASGPA